MKVTNISTCLDRPLVLMIGRQMEDQYRQFVFDCSGFGVDVASITLVHQRKKDTAPYIVTSSEGSNQLTWTVSDTDTAYAGYGRAELRITFVDGLAKSAIYSTLVLESITADTVIPEPLQSWYDAMIEYIDEHSISPDDIAQAVADYIEEHPITAPVDSVNGKTGVVVLTASDVGALPDSTVIPVVPTNVSAFTNDAGYISSVPSEYVTDTEMETVLSQYAEKSDIPTVPTKVSAFQNDAGYISSIPSQYVTESELQTALASKADTADIPTAVSELTNDSGYITASGAPVQSVNGQTGAVSLAIPTKTSDLTNDSGYVTTDTNTTYTISISSNVITLTPSQGQAQSITLPVYNGSVASGGAN